MSELTQALPGGFIELGMNRWTEPFWAAARERRLVGAQCACCGAFRMPPSPRCPECLSEEINWVELSGRGVVYSYTIVRETPYPGFEKVTFAPVVVDLPDAPGARLVGNLVGVVPEAIHIGMEVEVDWNPVKDGQMVPIFRPSRP